MNGILLTTDNQKSKYKMYHDLALTLYDADDGDYY